MRLAEGMHVEWVEGEAVVLNPSNGALHYLNPTAALVFAVIDEHGFEQGIQELQSRFADVEEFEDELMELIEQFQKEGLLIDE